MTPEELDRMFCNDGAYVLADPRYPGATAVVITMGSVHNKEGQCTQEGRMFMMEAKYELSKDPARWTHLPAHLCGGPFSVQTIEVARKHEETNQAEKEFLQHIIERCRGLLPQCQKLMQDAGMDAEARVAQDVMADIDILKEAQATIDALFTPPQTI